MEFNRQILVDYMKNSKIDNSYIYRLYKTYNNISKLTNNTFNESDLKQLEDSIYNYNGEKLDDEIRLKIEINNIKHYFDVKKIINNDICNEYKNVLDIYQKINLKDIDNVNYLKKQISILQAKLGMDNTFFLASKDAFIDIYRNIYIENINKYKASRR